MHISLFMNMFDSVNPQYVLMRNGCIFLDSIPTWQARRLFTLTSDKT